MAKNYVIKSPMNQLVEAHIDARFGDKYFGGSEDGSHHEHNYSEEDQASANLVAVCTNARTLYLSCDTIETIQHVYAPPRSFYQLTEVSLDRMNIDGWKFLACLLEYAPNLERLFMKGFSQFTNGFVQFKSSLLEVPTCLS